MPRSAIEDEHIRFILRRKATQEGNISSWWWTMNHYYIYNLTNWLILNNVADNESQTATEDEAEGNDPVITTASRTSII